MLNHQKEWKNPKESEVIDMPTISYHEFNNVMRELLKEQFPTTELLLWKGGDYVWDIVYELVSTETGAKLKYKPYDLYEKAEKVGNHEAVINGFFQSWREKIE